MKRRFKYQRVNLVVASSGATATVSVSQLQTGFERCNGIQLLSSAPATQLKGSYFRQFSIDGSEVLPENAEASMINSSNNVDPQKRFFQDFDHPRADGSTLQVQYVDGTNAGTYPYTVTLCLRLENGPNFKFENPAEEIGKLS